MLHVYNRGRHTHTTNTLYIHKFVHIYTCTQHAYTPFVDVGRHGRVDFVAVGV